MSKQTTKPRNSVAQWLVETYGVQHAEIIARANIAIGDGAPGYWQTILEAIQAVNRERGQ